MSRFASALRIAGATAWLIFVAGAAARAHDTFITFDLPDTIECRDVTPRDFAANHPTLKVIEAKLRVSARVVEGAETDIVDFLYIITSPDRRMKFQDYLPNTTLESAVSGDQIEVADTTENAEATNADAHVAYKVLALGGSKNQSSKKTGSNRYHQIVAKELVLASGTTDREHGVFFKLRTSRVASLEGAKEFTFLATVPKTWRGDWCTVSCAARARTKSFLARSTAPAGVEQAQIGTYLAGDTEAMMLAEELRRVQDAHAAVLARQLAKDGDSLLETMYAAVSSQAISGYQFALCGIFKCKKSEALGADHGKKTDPERKGVESAQQAVIDVQTRLRHLAE